jgi:hypothetical protein
MADPKFGFIECFPTSEQAQPIKIWVEVWSTVGGSINEGKKQETESMSLLLKQPRCPTADEWIKKIWCIYTMEFYSAVRKNDMWFEGQWMQLEDIMLSEVSQVQKDKGAMFSLIYGR